MLLSRSGFLGAVLIFFHGLCSADTTVSGAISASTRWTFSEAPYLLSGNVLVDNGAVLTIDPGVVIYMGEGAGVTVRGGSVKALGTPDKPIRILSDKSRSGSPAPGDWNNWTFENGSGGTRFDNTLFEYGKGLVFRGSSATFNNVDIRSQAGPAIAADLTTALSGAGNRASGNQINAIVLPAGVITGAMQTGLRGIPYLVTGGQLSVGAPPTVSLVSPAAVEQGESATLTITGSRLAGLGSLSFDRAIKDAAVLAGATDTSAAISLTVPTDAPPGPVVLQALTDAGEITKAGAFTVNAMQAPSLSGMTPRAVPRGKETTIVLSGSSLGAATVTASTPGLGVSGLSAIRTSLSFRLAVDSQVPLGIHPLQVANSVGGASIDVEILPQINPPPPYGLIPSVVVLAPDTVFRSVVLRAAQTSAQDRRFTVAVDNTAIAKVRSAEVLLPAGQYEASIAVAGVAAGMAVLKVSGGDLSAPLEAPINVASAGGLNQLQVSPAVGIVKGSGFVSPQGGGKAISRPVGIVKGSGMNNNAGQYISRPVGIDKGSPWYGGTGTWVSPRVGIMKR